MLTAIRNLLFLSGMAWTTHVLSIWVCMLLLYTLVGESESEMFVQPHLAQDMGWCLQKGIFLTASTL